MLRIHRSATALLVVVFLASVAHAQQGERKTKGGNRTPNPVAQLQRQLDELNLSDDQKAKVQDVLKVHTPKIEAAQKKMDETMTPEQRKARSDAMAKARSDGKKGRELVQAGSDAVKQTAEERAKFEEAQKVSQAAVADMRKAVMAVLTPEQQAKLTPARKGKNKA